MPLYQSDAFVLRTYKLGETDQIVVFFTRDFGKLRAVVRRGQSRRRPTSSYCQPLRLLYTVLFGRPSQSLFRLNSVDMVASMRPLHEDFGLLRGGLYLTELIDVTTREREPSPALFALYQQALEQLPLVPQPALLLRLFELRLLAAIGYAPQVFDCARCAAPLPDTPERFSPRLGGLLCARCAPEVRQALAADAAAVAFLRHAMTGDPGDEALDGLDAAAQQNLEGMLHAHLTSCLGRELKSYPFLHL